ncbi:hypothetical protein HBI14_024040 [Parastagonospora nodorum]|nr:hypothetical protein HBI14_024040 [Parastagonospora nodorum]
MCSLTRSQQHFGRGPARQLSDCLVEMKSQIGASQPQNNPVLVLLVAPLITARTRAFSTRSSICNLVLGHLDTSLSRSPTT